MLTKEREDEIREKVYCLLSKLDLGDFRRLFLLWCKDLLGEIDRLRVELDHSRNTRVAIKLARVNTELNDLNNKLCEVIGVMMYVKEQLHETFCTKEAHCSLCKLLDKEIEKNKGSDE